MLHIRPQPKLTADMLLQARRSAAGHVAQRMSTVVHGYDRRLAVCGLAIVVLLIIVAWQFTLLHFGFPGTYTRDAQAAVGRLMLLPSDEQPTIATVTDKAQLKDKFLADNAQDNDRVLIYAAHHLVIIYRPGINKIAAIGTASVDPALAQAKDTSLTILDGSNDPGKTQHIIQKVRAAYPDLTVIDGGMAARQDLPNTIVIDNTNDKDELMLSLVHVINGKRGIVPLGIQKSATDMMIIVGRD